MKKCFSILYISIILISGCEKGTVPVSNKTKSQPESEKIKQSIFKGMFKPEEKDNYFTDCSTARLFRLDPNGETITLKKKFDDAKVNDTLKSFYVEFEGFYSAQSSKEKGMSDSIIIPTRLLMTNVSKKCF